MERFTKLGGLEYLLSLVLSLDTNSASRKAAIHQILATCNKIISVSPKKDGKDSMDISFLSKKVDLGKVLQKLMDIIESLSCTIN